MKVLDHTYIHTYIQKARCSVKKLHAVVVSTLSNSLCGCLLQVGTFPRTALGCIEARTPNLSGYVLFSLPLVFGLEGFLCIHLIIPKNSTCTTDHLSGYVLSSVPLVFGLEGFLCKCFKNNTSPRRALVCMKNRDLTKLDVYTGVWILLHFKVNCSTQIISEPFHVYRN